MAKHENNINSCLCIQHPQDTQNAIFIASILGLTQTKRGMCQSEPCYPWFQLEAGTGPCLLLIHSKGLGIWLKQSQAFTAQAWTPNTYVKARRGSITL